MGNGRAATDRDGPDVVDRWLLRRRGHLVRTARELLHGGEVIVTLVAGGADLTRRGVVVLTDRRLLLVPPMARPVALSLDDVSGVAPITIGGQGKVLLRHRRREHMQIAIGRPSVLDVRPTRAYRRFCSELLASTRRA